MMRKRCAVSYSTTCSPQDGKHGGQTGVLIPFTLHIWNTTRVFPCTSHVMFSFLTNENSNYLRRTIPPSHSHIWQLHENEGKKSARWGLMSVDGISTSSNIQTKTWNRVQGGACSLQWQVTDLLRALCLNNT